VILIHFGIAPAGAHRVSRQEAEHGRIGRFSDVNERGAVIHARNGILTPILRISPAPDLPMRQKDRKEHTSFPSPPLPWLAKLTNDIMSALEHGYLADHNRGSILASLSIHARRMAQVRRRERAQML
jgi:hypothetical protein